MTAHYVKKLPTPYWVGTGRMQQFLQRMQNATLDGLDPAAYPIDQLRQIAAEAQSGGAAEGGEGRTLLLGLLHRLCC